MLSLKTKRGRSTRLVFAILYRDTIYLKTAESNALLPVSSAGRLGSFWLQKCAHANISSCDSSLSEVTLFYMTELPCPHPPEIQVGALLYSVWREDYGRVCDARETPRGRKFLVQWDREIHRTWHYPDEFVSVEISR